MENIPESVVPSGPVSLARTQESHWGVSATSLPINTDVTVQIQTLISHTSFRIVIFFFMGSFFPSSGYCHGLPAVSASFQLAGSSASPDGSFPVTLLTKS